MTIPGILHKATERGRAALAATALVLAAVAAYHNSLDGPFVFDDWPTIRENPSIRGPSLAAALRPSPANTASGRPLLNVSLALNRAWSGDAVWSYHLLNVAIHALAGLALFGLVRRTLGQSRVPARLQRGSLPLGFAVALLWTVHPLQSESVTYIVQRAESLMGLFYLLTLYAFSRAVHWTAPDDKSGSTRAWLWSAVSIAACACGMATKEVMVSAPVMALLYDRAFVSGSFRESWRRHRGTLLGLAAGWLVLAAGLASTGGNRDGSVGFGTGVPFVSYWLTQPRAILRYLELAFWPHPLVFEYGTEWITRASQVIPHALVVLPLAGLAVWAAWRWPQPGFAGAWFFALLAPTSLMPGINQMIVEHRMYLPVAAIVALAVVGGRILLGQGILAIAVAVSAGFILITHRRNDDYRDEVSLWSDTVAKRPANALAHRILADVLWQDPAGARLDRIAVATSHYEMSLRLMPDSPVTHENFGAALFLAGETESGMRHTREALRLDPERPLAHYNLGLAQIQLGQLAVATREFESAVRLDPRFVNAHKNLGNALAASGRPAAALACYETALRLRPVDAETLYNLGNALAALGRHAEAIARYEAALRLTPDDADAHERIATALNRTGQAAAALAHLDRAMQLRLEGSRRRHTASPSGGPQIERGRR